MGRPELIDEPRFNSNGNRIKNVEALDEIVGGWFKEHDFDELIAILNENEVPVGPVMDIVDIIKDVHAKEREMVIRAPDDERGSLLMEGVFPRMSLTPGEVRHTGKKLGADNREIYGGKLGLSAEELAELAKGKII